MRTIRARGIVACSPRARPRGEGRCTCVRQRLPAPGIRAARRARRARSTAICGACRTLPPFDGQARHRAACRDDVLGAGAAHAYKAAAAAARTMSAVLVGPSHFVSLRRGGGVSRTAPSRRRSAWRRRSTRARRRSRGVADRATRWPRRIVREHSLEMQLPFLRRVLPDVPIVPMLMGFQRRETIRRPARTPWPPPSRVGACCWSPARTCRTISTPRRRSRSTRGCRRASRRSMRRACLT